MTTFAGTSERRLYRDADRAVLGGVCAGLANYFDMDPVVVRVIFAFLLVFAGGGLVAYLVLWIVMPEDAGGS